MSKQLPEPESLAMFVREYIFQVYGFAASRESCENFAHRVISEAESFARQRDTSNE
jgi:hypothetical protein